MNAREALLAAFQDGKLAKKNLTEICKILGLPYRERTRLQKLLNALVDDGALYVNDEGRYGTSAQLGLIRGRICGNERGFAFLLPDDKASHPDDFFIPRKNLHGALHGDLVLIERVFGRSDDEGNVVRILERGYTTVVGTFRRDRRAGYLIPDEKRFHTEIYIPLSSCNHVRNNVKAVAKITSYPYGKAPSGELTEILGDDDDFFAEELSIIRSYDLRETFPPQAEKEAARQAARGVTQADMQARRDFRRTPVVTIDGADTRDIDDAVSLERTENGYLLGVHIADVTHYVPFRSALDKEAYERGTSVYFPDRVLPMLPRALSNGICSLNEGEDRLTLSCLIRLDNRGKVIGGEIVEGVIRSTHKMTYDEVESILNGDETLCAKYADVKDMVCLFGELTKILQSAREIRGSVSLDVKEAKILFENGEISIPEYERKFSRQIIESFMVLANETVAEYAKAAQAPFLYRIHEKPLPEKATAFRDFAQSLGLTAKFRAENVSPRDYQKLLKSAEDLPVYPVLNRVMLRSMQKARYAPENIGHFGLASDCYCHFTSPIRRYPDLCIHRILKLLINGGRGEAVRLYGDYVEKAAIQASERERRANDAERDVDDLYATMYMSERLGETYEAVVSGVTDFGLFAELPNTIEGFLPIETLADDFEYDEARFMLCGRKTSYALGERLLVRVHDVDFERRRTEFKLLKKL